MPVKIERRDPQLLAEELQESIHLYISQVVQHRSEPSSGLRLHFKRMGQLLFIDNVICNQNFTDLLFADALGIHNFTSINSKVP